MIELDANHLAVSFPELPFDPRLTIDFQRTLRIPDDGKDYDSALFTLVVIAGVLSVVGILWARAARVQPSDRDLVQPRLQQIGGRPGRTAWPEFPTVAVRLHDRTGALPVGVDDLLNGSCADCGSTQDLEFAHVRPLSKGGSRELWNVQLLCRQCNWNIYESI
jgi:hypothetical protein